MEVGGDNIMVLDKLVHKLLLKLPVETAHNLGRFGMDHSFLAPGRYRTSQSVTPFFGFDLDNPLGLAAGFDKNGVLVNAVSKYGFGWVEVGSITAGGGKGNNKPRLFRLKGGSLLNRMGLNGDPAYKTIERLKHAEQPFAVNIAKTNDPAIVGEKAIADILDTYTQVVEKLEPKKKLLYTVLNISCPNTEDGRTFEDKSALRELLQEITTVATQRPLLLKISPVNGYRELGNIVEVADNHIQGYIATNTLSVNHEIYGWGGLSGQFLRASSSSVFKMLREQTAKPIIGCGGLETGRDAYRMLGAGAYGVQAFTGFILGQYNGPKFAHKVNEELDALRTLNKEQQEKQYYTAKTY